MMISVIIVPTHVPVNVVQVIVYFKILRELEYNVVTRTTNSIVHCMIGLIKFNNLPEE